jgi:hypothetical protein
MPLPPNCLCTDLSHCRPGPEGLAPGERLLLCALRAWPRLADWSDSAEAAVRDGVAEAAGPMAAVLLVDLLESLEADAPRDLDRRCLCERSLTADEHRLVLACGLATLFPEAAERLLAPLAPNAAARIVGLARPLASELARAGLALPVRLTALDDRPAAPQMTGQGALLDRPVGLLPSHRH